MVKKEIFGYATSVVANTSLVVVETSQLDHLLQTAILVVGLLSGILSILYTGFKWYLKATDPKGPGGSKITIGEIKEGFEEVQEAVENVNKDK